MILLDAYALVALLGDEPAAREVELLLRQGSAGITTMNLAEALDVLERRDNLAEERLRELLGPLLVRSLRVVPPSTEDAWRAAALRVRHYRRRDSALSLADCFLLATARSEDSIATSDAPVARAARAEGVALHPLPDSTGVLP